MFCDELLIVITATQGRLNDLLQDLQAEAVDQAAEDAAEAAFDSSLEGERVHRYQAQWGRAMIQTLEAIRKPKRDAASKAPAEEPVAAVAEAAPFVGQDSKSCRRSSFSGQDWNLVPRGSAQRRAVTQFRDRCRGRRPGRVDGEGRR
jgi:hypothetical protein